MIKSVKSRSGLGGIEVYGHHSISIHKRQMVLSETDAAIRRHFTRGDIESCAGLVYCSAKKLHPFAYSQFNWEFQCRYVQMVRIT